MGVGTRPAISRGGQTGPICVEALEVVAVIRGRARGAHVDTLSVRTYDVRKIGESDVARLRWIDLESV